MPYSKSAKYKHFRIETPSRFEEKSFKNVPVSHVESVPKKFDKAGNRAVIAKTKDTGEWRVQAYQIPKQKYINKIMAKGGSLENTTISQKVDAIAKKYGISAYDAIAKIQDGAKVELEHKNTVEYIKEHPQISEQKAAELIAIDHILDKMEKTLANGGLVKGGSHASGNDVPVIDEKTGKDLGIRVEGEEVVINKRAVKSEESHEFDGKKMTNKEVLNEINTSTGGNPIMSEGGEVKSCGCQMADGGGILTPQIEFDGKEVIYSIGNVNDENFVEFSGTLKKENGNDVFEIGWTRDENADTYYSEHWEDIEKEITDAYYAKRKPKNKMADGGEIRYKIMNKHDRTFLNSGTDKPSWFSLEDARKIVDYDKGQIVVEHNGQDVLWEVLSNGGEITPSYDDWFSKIRFYKSGNVDSYELPNGTKGIGKKENTEWFKGRYAKLYPATITTHEPSNMTFDEFVANQLEFVKGRASGFSAKDEWFVIIHKDKEKTGKPETSRSRKLDRDETPSWDGLNSYSKDFIKGVHQSLINNRILKATGNKPILDLPQIAIGLQLKKEESSDIYEISRLEQDEVCITKQTLFKGEKNEEICTSWDELIENINNNLIKADGFETNKEFALAVQSYLSEQEKQSLIAEQEEAKRIEKEKQQQESLVEDMLKKQADEQESKRLKEIEESERQSALELESANDIALLEMEMDERQKELDSPEFEVKYYPKTELSKKKAKRHTMKTWVNAKDRKGVLEIIKTDEDFKDFGELISIKKK
jgi:hypothetical protein